MKSSKNHEYNKQPLVSLIVLTYNGKEDTIEFLESLKKTDYPNYEIIVVDNASTDGTTEAVIKKFKNIKVIENKKNLGFAGGMNSGIKESKGKYVVLLNNDFVASQKEWLSLLVNAVESDDIVGIAIPMILYYDTDIIESLGKTMPGIFTKLISTTFLLGHKKKDKGQFREKIEIVAGNGLVRRDVFEDIGLLDEKMFIYFEEMDFSFRARQAGYKVICEPRSKLWHKGSATIKEGSYFAIYHNYKNKIRFILKDYDSISKVFALSFNSIYYIFLIISYSLKGRPDLSKAVIDGVIWNFRNWKDYV